jgi:transcriptional regulator with XRE-family HTH domain
MKIFGERLRERAAELGISNAEVARRSGLTERRYSNYVAGIREPDLVTLVRIAGALQTTPNVLLGVGEKSKSTVRSLLVDRINSALENVNDDHLEVIALQIEALAGRGRKPRSSK